MLGPVDEPEFRLPDRVGYVIKQLHHALARLIDDALTPTGLTRTQFTALTHLRHHGPMSGAELARADLVSPQAASTLLDRLAQRGLIDRRPRDGSRRDLHAHLTATGHAAQHRAARLVAAAEDRLTAQLGAAESARLLALASQLTGLAEQHVTGTPPSQREPGPLRG
jgi:DNA-binding MarR family transcriptional regulator